MDIQIAYLRVQPMVQNAFHLEKLAVTGHCCNLALSHTCKAGNGASRFCAFTYKKSAGTARRGEPHQSRAKTIVTRDWCGFPLRRPDVASNYSVLQARAPDRV